MKTIKYIPGLLLTTALMLGVISCKDDEQDELALSRRFTPSTGMTTAGPTQVTLRWSPSLFTVAGEVEYAVEVSDALTFNSIAYSVITTNVEVVVTDNDIQIKKDYYARVKAIGKNGMADSHWLVSTAFQITGEQLFIPVKESDVIDNAVILHWVETEGITKIVFTTQQTSFEVAITNEESLTGEKLIDGLNPNTTYTAEIFKGEVSKGTVTFTTKLSFEGDNVIDLRGITGRPNVLADTLGQIPSGSIVLLKRGTQYTIPSTKSLDRSVTITSGADFNPELATVFMPSNFNLVAGSSIDSLVFRDLYMYSNDYAAKYIFNINQVGTIGKVKFENVRGHRFRGFFRMQTGTTGTQVQDFIMNNCVIDSLRDFSLVNTNNLNAVANISVKNTTLYNCRKVIDHRSPGSNSIVFENCTFNNLPGGGPAGVGASLYFIDLGTQNSANPIIISNCIFGKSWDDQGLGNDARGIQVGASTTVSVTNTYSLSDFVSTNATYQIPGLSAYPSSSTSVYTDPANGNFTIKDNSFPGKNSAGDPRWRQ